MIAKQLLKHLTSSLIISFFLLVTYEVHAQELNWIAPVDDPNVKKWLVNDEQYSTEVEAYEAWKSSQSWIVCQESFVGFLYDGEVARFSVQYRLASKGCPSSGNWLTKDFYSINVAETYCDSSSHASVLDANKDGTPEACGRQECKIELAEGNPISCSSGQKIQYDNIYQGSGADALNFTTIYS
uniref:hypothetical protein n=1 Tax=Aliikangiella sp. G2MR2-5 TaxID=2788943 RepID=UPI0018A9FC35